MDDAATPPSALAATSDAELLVVVGGGDRGLAMRTLYQRYAGRIFGLGVQLLGDRGLAEELVQESFVRIWRNAERFDPERGSASTFVFTIARRLAVDLWRRPSSRPGAPLEEVEADLRVEDEAERIVVRLGVGEAIGSLPAHLREVLELSFRDQLKQAEIADRLGIPLGTVKSRSYHGLRALKDALEQRNIHV